MLLTLCAASDPKLPSGLKVRHFSLPFYDMKSGVLLWELKGENARFLDPSDDIEVVSPQIIFFEQGDEITLYAERAVYRKKSELCELQGQVSCMSGNGMSFESVDADMDLSNRILNLPNRIQLRGIKGLSLESEAATYHIAKRQLQCRGATHCTLPEQPGQGSVNIHAADQLILDLDLATANFAGGVKLTWAEGVCQSQYLSLSFSRRGKEWDIGGIMARGDVHVHSEPQSLDIRCGELSYSRDKDFFYATPRENESLDIHYRELALVSHRVEGTPSSKRFEAWGPLVATLSNPATNAPPTDATVIRCSQKMVADGGSALTTFSGNVSLQQGEMQLDGDEMELHFETLPPELEHTRLSAHGHVRGAQPSKSIAFSGDHLHYSKREDLLYISASGPRWASVEHPEGRVRSKHIDLHISRGQISARGESFLDLSFGADTKPKP